MMKQKFLGAVRALKAQDPATIRKHLPSVRRAYEQTVKELLDRELLDRDLTREINRDALHLVELEMRQLESQANEFESDKLKLERG